MRFKVGKRVFLLGRKANDEHRARLKAAVQAAVREAARKSDATKPIDYNEEFDALKNPPPGGHPCFNDNSLSARDRITTVTSYLAEQLRWLIALKLHAGRGRYPSRGEMREVFEGYGPIASFANRINVAVVLGMISDDVKNDLRTMKGIRNDFAAHSFGPLSFDNPLLIAECEKLKLCVKLDRKWGSDAETRFMESAHLISMTLTFVAYLLSEEAKLVGANADDIIKKAKTHWNEALKGTSIPPVDLALDASPDKSREGM